MAPRTSWKGFIRLSLVSVPVKAFTSSNSGEEVRLNQLHADCNSRVRYQKVCPEHGVLKTEDIVSGYEYAKDEYVIIDGEELNKIRKQSDKSVSIVGFVPPEEIDPIYFAGRTYYLAPDGVVGNRPYVLLREGMIERGVCALAQVILSGREQLVLLRPVDGLITMVVLQHEARVKPVDEYTDLVEEQELSQDEKNLANTLIQASTLQEFDYAKYKDEYVGELKRLIQLKVEGQEIVQAPDHEEPKILNLMDALKQSVAAAQAAQSDADAVADAGDHKMAASEPEKTEKTAKRATKKASRKMTPSGGGDRRKKAAE